MKFLLGIPFWLSRWKKIRGLLYILFYLSALLGFSKGSRTLFTSVVPLMTFLLSHSYYRLHGLLDSMLISIFLILTTSGKLCTVLFLGYGILSSLSVSTQFLHCVLLLKLVEVRCLRICLFFFFFTVFSLCLFVSLSLSILLQNVLTKIAFCLEIRLEWNPSNPSTAPWRYVVVKTFLCCLKSIWSSINCLWCLDMQSFLS